MKKTIFSLSILLIILAVIISFLIVIIVNEETENIVKNYEYSYTKAICNEKMCQDYVVVCRGNTKISQTPITGAVIKISKKFQDPRSKDIIESYCNLN